MRWRHWLQQTGESCSVCFGYFTTITQFRRLPRKAGAEAHVTPAIGAPPPHHMTTSTCQLTNTPFVDIVRSMADPAFIHPGIIVRQNCLERFNLTVTEGALILGVSRQALTNLLSGKAGISPEMALRLDKAFGGGAETWLQRQLLHDLAKARLRLDELNVVPVVSAQQPALF